MSLLEDQSYSAAEAGPAPQSSSMNLYQLHLLMRGRYPLAIALSVVLATAGAITGYKMGKKTYQSSATIRIAPTTPKVMYNTDEQRNDHYESFVDTQMAMIHSRRVIEMAMTLKPWTNLGKVSSDQG